MSAIDCPNNPTGHDWNNSLVCGWCGATRTPAEAIVSGLASRRGGDETNARALLDAHRAEVTVKALNDAANALSHIHKACTKGRERCAGCQVRTDILDVLRSLADVLGEKATATAPTATPTFFEAGHTYAATYITGIFHFQCHLITRLPDTGATIALGYHRRADPTAVWVPADRDTASWESGNWTDIGALTTTRKDRT